MNYLNSQMNELKWNNNIYKLKGKNNINKTYNSKIYQYIAKNL